MPGLNLKDTFSNIETRSFDKYLLGPFMIWYGLKSKKMSRWPRRIMITAGIFQVMYNLNAYKKLPQTIAQKPADIIESVT